MITQILDTEKSLQDSGCGFSITDIEIYMTIIADKNHQKQTKNQVLMFTNPFSPNHQSLTSKQILKVFKPGTTISPTPYKGAFGEVQSWVFLSSKWEDTLDPQGGQLRQCSAHTLSRHLSQVYRTLSTSSQISSVALMIKTASAICSQERAGGRLNILQKRLRIKQGDRIFSENQNKWPSGFLFGIRQLHNTSWSHPHLPL